MTAPASILVKKQDADAFEAEDSIDDRFFIAGKVRGRVLEYVIVTKILSTKEQSSIPAQDFFNAMMSHFATKRTSIHVISDEWSEVDPDLRTQLDRFNNNILGGDTEPVAASKSFTGRMAGRWGFTNSSIPTLLPPGARGNYREVRVDFMK